MNVAFFFFGTMADPIVMKDACDFLGLGVLY
jgi:hypothetical protein